MESARPPCHETWRQGREYALWYRAPPITPKASRVFHAEVKHSLSRTYAKFHELHYLNAHYRGLDWINQAEACVPEPPFYWQPLCGFRAVQHYRQLRLPSRDYMAGGWHARRWCLYAIGNILIWSFLTSPPSSLMTSTSPASTGSAAWNIPGLWPISWLCEALYAYYIKYIILLSRKLLF